MRGLDQHMLCLPRSPEGQLSRVLHPLHRSLTGVLDEHISVLVFKHLL